MGEGLCGLLLVPRPVDKKFRSVTEEWKPGQARPSGFVLAVQEGAFVILTAWGPMSVRDFCLALSTCNSNQDQEGAVEAVDTSYLPGLDDSVALRCLAFLSPAEHWRLALLSNRHKELCQQSVLLKLRRDFHIVEQWICIYTSGNSEWTAFDPRQNTWRNLPPVTVSPGFGTLDKESLSAGTHLLWIGRNYDNQGILHFACHKYDIARNRWEEGPTMNDPRCLYAGASCGTSAYVAGGFDMQFNVMNSAERYDSLSGEWELLAPMAVGRQKCSGFFMDGKFYVIGGKDQAHQFLTSGEEYDPVRNVWRIINNMYPAPILAQGAEPSPPLVAVASNELYAIESSHNLLKAYNKLTNTWRVLGPVPVRADRRNGWGLAFKALGDKLFVIGGCQQNEVDRINVFCCRPQPGATTQEWRLVNSRVRYGGDFLFNCAVMSF